MEEIDFIFSLMMTFKSVLLLFIWFFFVYGTSRLWHSAQYRSYWEAYKDHYKEVPHGSKPQ